ncbi:hypothetical protein [Thalassiella azotivora]
MRATPAGPRPGGTRVRALLTAGAASAAALLLGLLVPLGCAASAGASPVAPLVGSGPHVATRAADGTTTLTLTVWNVEERPVQLALDATSPCEDPDTRPGVAASSQNRVTFEMRCSGEGRTTATLQASAPSDPAGAPATTTVTFTVQAPSTPDAGPIWRSFLWGALVALVAVVPPYLVWLANPRGNRDEDAGEHRAARDDASAAGRGDQSAWHRLRAALELELPGIAKDWSFADSWATSAGLATALFTGVFAATDPLALVLGTESSRVQSTVVVASAAAAALTAAAPLLLVIGKRRYATRHGGVARHHTVAGVLAASLVVVAAGSGLIVTVATLLPGGWVTAVATAAVALLVVYSWKSIPQTLALGRYGEGVTTAAEGAVAVAPSRQQAAGLP